MEIILGDYPLHKVLDISLAGMWDDTHLVHVNIRISRIQRFIKYLPLW